MKMKELSNLRYSRKLFKLKYRIVTVSFISVLCLFFYLLTYSHSPAKNEDSSLLLGVEWLHDTQYSTFDIRTKTISAQKNISKEIIILRYTKYFGGYEPAEVLTGTQCNYLQKSLSARNRYSPDIFTFPCRITFDRIYFNDSSALVFHSRDLLTTELPTGKRNMKQLWVYLQQESPIYTKADLKNYSNVFNWTMTYRRDSDVYHPYGYLVARAIEDKNSAKLDFNPTTLLNKTGLVAWIVSGCEADSKRELFVAELQKYLTIDIFGACGHECPSQSVQDCYSYVASNYKFYLSFENSLCTDYITEKFYKALRYQMLPIVYGGNTGTLDYKEISPDNSYIDATSFDSPKDLANYILHLSKNDAEFLRYFEWKKEYQLEFAHHRWCDLCQRIHEHLNEFPRQIKWYKDLWKWWNYVEYNDKNITIKSDRSKVGRKACVSPPKKFTEF